MNTSEFQIGFLTGIIAIAGLLYFFLYVRRSYESYELSRLQIEIAALRNDVAKESRAESGKKIPAPASPPVTNPSGGIQTSQPFPNPNLPAVNPPILIPLDQPAVAVNAPGVFQLAQPSSGPPPPPPTTNAPGVFQYTQPQPGPFTYVPPGQIPPPQPLPVPLRPVTPVPPHPVTVSVTSDNQPRPATPQ